MENPLRQSDISGNNDSTFENWKETVTLLKHLLASFQDSRAQLDRLSGILNNDEALISQHLLQIDREPVHFRVMCLMPPGTGPLTSRMGRAILAKASIEPVSILARDKENIMRLDVSCLGPLRIRSAHRLVQHWQSTRAKSIFEYLLTRNRTPVARDILIEALWPEHNTRAAGNSLKTAVHALRQTLNYVLGRDDNYPSILFSQGSYLINPDIELRVDAEEFETCWVNGRQMEKEECPGPAVIEYEKAAALYRGDYLEDEPYEEWTLLRREAIKDNYLFILGKLADHAIAVPDFEGCIFYCQKILARDPSREDTYRRIMRCYNRLGQKNQALRWYENCCQALRNEMDASPDNETSALYNSILKGDSV